MSSLIYTLTKLKVFLISAAYICILMKRIELIGIREKNVVSKKVLNIQIPWLNVLKH